MVRISLIIVIVIALASCSKAIKEDCFYNLEKDLNKCNCPVQYGSIRPYYDEFKLFIQINNGVDSVAFTTKGSRVEVLNKTRYFLNEFGCNIPFENIANFQKPKYQIGDTLKYLNDSTVFVVYAIDNTERTPAYYSSWCQSYSEDRLIKKSN